MIIKRYKEDELFRHIFWISVVYFLAHGFLLIATGRWWDDWVYADKNWEYLYEVMRQSSLPWLAYLDASLWLFPDGFYRIFVFSLYYIGALFFYFILKKVGIFRLEECLWITLLFITIPVNDARITWICFPYTFGYCVFFIAFYVSLLWQDFDGKKRWMVRGASIMLLIVAYSFLESTMMLTALPLAYFYYKELRENWEWSCSKKNVNSFFKTVSHYLDYLLAPIIWYFGDKLLFPGYGVYGGHSYIPWTKLPTIILYSPKHTLSMLKSILLSYATSLRWIFSYEWICLTLLVLGCYYLIKSDFIERRNQDGLSNSDFKDVSMTVVGCAAFFLGCFPYLVKFGCALGNTHTIGRNCILLGIGTALFLYFGVHLVIRYSITKLVVLMLIVEGIVHFNIMYFDWQESYYQQLQLQCGMKQNESIKNNDTFLVMEKGSKICEVYYQINGNSWAAFGNQTRIYLHRSDLSWFSNTKDKTYFYLKAYMMKAYDYGEGVIDGVIFIDYKKIGRKTLVKQKWNELFNRPEFESWIDRIKDVKYVPLTAEESRTLLELNSSGKLDDAMIYDMFYR